MLGESLACKEVCILLLYPCLLIYTTFFVPVGCVESKLKKNRSDPKVYSKKLWGTSITGELTSPILIMPP